jgi:TRAP transporter TAXI family solute receptor
MVKSNRNLSVILIVALVFFLGALPAVTSAEEPVNIRFASFKIGSGHYTMAGVISDIIKKYLPAGSTADALPKSGGIGNLKLLGIGKAELATAFPPTAKWAWNGVNPPYPKQIRNIRAIAGGLDNYWHLGAFKEGVDAKDWADVKNKKMGLRICTQSKGSLSAFAAAQIMDEFGFTANDLKSWGGALLLKGFKEMVPGLKEGAFDAFLMLATPRHPTWTELAIARPLNFVNLDDAMIAKLSEKYGFLRSTVPAGMFHGQEKDVVTVGFPTCILAREDLSAEVVYQVTKAIAENKAKIASAYSAFKVFDPKTAWKPEKLGGIPLHPGAEKYYKEQGWM